ncbi:MAG: hypothetical protein WAV11_02545 [Minisyncoccia bacterium]
MSIEEIKEKIKPSMVKIRSRGVGFKNNLRNKVMLVSDSNWKSDLFIFLVIILVGLVGFGLGRLSGFESNNETLDIKKLICPQNFENKLSLKTADGVLTEVAKTPDQKGMLVASKSGTRYYFPWCSGVSRISEANKVWYNSYEEAQAAGLTAASGCLGLK